MPTTEKDLQQERSQMGKLALLAHEFKTPLSVTMSTLELLQTKMKQRTDVYCEEYETLFGIAMRNLYKSLRMANNFVDADRLFEGKVKLNVETVDLVQMLQQIADTVMPMLTMRDAHIDFASKVPAPFFINVDKQAMERVFLNLLSNAIKHLPAQNGRILLGLTVDGQSARISVTDNGSGISEEMQPHVFEQYWHNSDTNSVDRVGTGLGLYIVQLFMQLHGGAVAVESLPHLTTTFTLTLPQAVPEPSDPSALRSSKAPYGGEMFALLLRQELADFI